MTTTQGIPLSRAGGFRVGFPQIRISYLTRAGIAPFCFITLGK